MRTRKLAVPALAALIGASTLFVGTPASARLVCNQYGNCHWTHRPGDYVPSRWDNRQYESQWNVRIHGARHHGDTYRYGDYDHNNYDRHRARYDRDNGGGY